MQNDWLKDKAFAHRGLHSPQKNIVENSMSAFDNAAQYGYGLELDVLLSKDNKAIVIHDETLDRLTHETGKIIEHSSSELSKINLRNSKDNIPTLKEVLDQINGSVPILVEIKGDQEKFSEIAEAVFRDMKNYKGNIAVMSFYPEIISRFKTLSPNTLCGLVATSINDASLPTEYFDVNKQISLLNTVDFMAYDIRALPNNATETYRKLGKPVLTWTVRSDQNRSKAKQYTDNIIFEL